MKYHIKKTMTSLTPPDQDTSVPAVPVLEPLPSMFKEKTPSNKTSDSVRAAVIQAVLEQGLTLKAAAEKFNLNRDTISAIFREYQQETGEIENIRLGNKFHNLADKVLNELNDRDLSAASTSQLGVLAGISVDKKILLTGKPAGSGGSMNLRIAWKNGSGAVELSTGEHQE